MVISRKNRKKIIFLVYRHILINDDKKSFLNWSYLTLPNEEVRFFLPILKDLLSKKEKLISIIESNLKNWLFVRLGIVEQAILLFSSYEIIYLKTDPLIVINESIKIAKKYCEKKSYAFINSVLDKIYNFAIINKNSTT